MQPSCCPPTCFQTLPVPLVRNKNMLESGNISAIPGDLGETILGNKMSLFRVEFPDFEQNTPRLHFMEIPQHSGGNSKKQSNWYFLQFIMPLVMRVTTLCSHHLCFSPCLERQNLYLFSKLVLCVTYNRHHLILKPQLQSFL